MGIIGGRLVVLALNKVALPQGLHAPFVTTAALVIFGGEVIRSFTIAMLFGVIVGTYSSIYIAAPVLILFKLRSDNGANAKDDEDEAAQPAVAK